MFFYRYAISVEIWKFEEFIAGNDSRVMKRPQNQLYYPLKQIFCFLLCKFSDSRSLSVLKVTTCLALSPVKEGHYQVLESYYSPAHYIAVSDFISPQLIFCFPHVVHLHFVFPAGRSRQPISIKTWGNSSKIVT